MSSAFLSLPSELITLILSKTDYATSTALTQTCKALHSYPPKPPQHQYTMVDLLQI